MWWQHLWAWWRSRTPPWERAHWEARVRRVDRRLDAVEVETRVLARERGPYGQA